jgi:uncharacterized protein
MHEPMPGAEPDWTRRSTTAVAPWWHTVLIVALLGGTSVLGARAAHRDVVAAHHAARYAVGIAMEWLLLLLVWWGLRIRHVPFSDLPAFRRGRQALIEDFGAAATFWVLAMVVLTVIGLLLKLAGMTPPQKTLMQIAPQSPLEVLLWLVLSISAGFCEEFVFRGYFLRQFSSLGAGLVLGVLCSSLLFGISHGYEGAEGMIAITAYGAMFCVLALSRRTLRPGMIAHAWHDIFSGVMLALLHHFHQL